MARTHQQVSGAFVSVNEQTHNGRHSAINEVKKQARQLSNVEHNINTMRVAMEPVETMIIHMTQNLQAQPLQQSIQQNQQAR